MRVMNEKKEKRTIPKINSIHFGWIWIAAGLLTGVVIPVILWLILHIVVWPLIVMGGIILVIFGIIFAVEMHQDSGKVPYYEKNLTQTIPFDPDTQYAVIRSSICTGEKVAGFKNKDDGHFTEVMLIRTPEEKQRFMEMYHLETVRTEY